MDFRGKIKPVFRIGFAGGAVEVVVIAHDGHEEILDFQSLFIHLQPVCESVPIVTAVFPRLPERIGRTEEYLPVIGKIVAQDFHDRRSGGGVL